MHKTHAEYKHRKRITYIPFIWLIQFQHIGILIEIGLFTLISYMYTYNVLTCYTILLCYNKNYTYNMKQSYSEMVTPFRFQMNILRFVPWLCLSIDTYLYKNINMSMRLRIYII